MKKECGNKEYVRMGKIMGRISCLGLLKCWVMVSGVVVLGDLFG